MAASWKRPECRRPSGLRVDMLTDICLNPLSGIITQPHDDLSKVGTKIILRHSSGKWIMSCSDHMLKTCIYVIIYLENMFGKSN